MRNETRVSVHKFHNMEDLGFSPDEYSLLKFGDDDTARRFGYQLAELFFELHADVLLTNQAVVIPSPYNHVMNAASILARHMVDRLNDLLVHANGTAVEWSTIHRKVSYTNDYGTLSADIRKALLDNDRFFFNKEFIQGKVLIFVDDVLITGTHEQKLQQIMTDAHVYNRSFFLYYGEKLNAADPEIESKLNTSSIRTLSDYLNLLNENNVHMLVRPIKFVLGQSSQELECFIQSAPIGKLVDLYYGALGEGYNRIPKYQSNLMKVREYLVSRGRVR